MLVQSFGLNFFLKTPRKKANVRSIYLRVTVDGVPKEISTKNRWDITRWDQKTERAIGSKEDARVLNLYLESLEMKVSEAKIAFLNNGQVLTSQKIIDYLLGKSISRAKVLEEFQLHNDEILALVPKEYAKGTHERFVTARSHVKDFIKFKFDTDDIEFRELNYEFVKDYEFYLKTVRYISNNTALKYIANFKKIVLSAVKKEIIATDPFKLFTGKKTKTNKKPLTGDDLAKIQKHVFSTERLSEVRDIFVFQCYTGLAYIDAYKLRKSDIKSGVDGEPWIMINRQKTESETNVPLLPKALEIINRYKGHPLCLQRGTVLPVKSNQKMNAYLKEIADLAGVDCQLNTHKARRTFASTVTLANNVPIHVVRDMLGHSSVKQTEEYAITEQQSIGKEMKQLQKRLNNNEPEKDHSSSETISKLQQDIIELKQQIAQTQRA